MIDYRPIHSSTSYLNIETGALPPLASITIVRVINFTVYQRAKHAFSDAVERVTGVSPLVSYNTPGSMPTLSTVSCFMFSGMIAGLAATPLACNPQWSTLFYHFSYRL